MLMKMVLEGKEIEAVLEKAWDLHDKISDAIHSLSESAFQSSRLCFLQQINNAVEEREYYEDDILAETRSLTDIRNALEVLEDQLHLLHIRQAEQGSERDAALIQLEESRLVLLKRLKEHRGREWEFIQEALAIGIDKSEDRDLHVTSGTFSYPTLAEVDSARYSKEKNKFDNKIEFMEKNKGLTHFLSLSIQFVKGTIRFQKMASVVAKAALVTVSMLAIYGIQQIGRGSVKKYELYGKLRAQINNNQCKEQFKFINIEDNLGTHREIMAPLSHLWQKHLDVALGRG